MDEKKVNKILETWFELTAEKDYSVDYALKTTAKRCKVRVEDIKNLFRTIEKVVTKDREAKETLNSKVS